MNGTWWKWALIGVAVVLGVQLGARMLKIAVPWDATVALVLGFVVMKSVRRRRSA